MPRRTTPAQPHAFGRARLLAAGGVRLATLAVGVAGVAMILAWQPFLALGVTLGALVVWITVSWPLLVVGAMLTIGPVDLSFLTGGVRELFPQLGGLDMNGIRLVGLTIGLSVVVITDRALLRSVLAPPALFYLLFLGYGAASLAWSPDPLGGVRLLLKIGYPLLAFLIITAPGRTVAEVDRLASWALAGAALLLLVNPGFVIAGGLERDLQGHLRLDGPGIHQNPFSFYLLIIVLLSAARFARRAQARYAALAVLAAGWLVLTGTRITLAASLVGLTGMGAFGALVKGSRRDAVIAVGLGAIVGLLLAPIGAVRTFGYLPDAAQLYAFATDPVSLFNAINWQGRDIFWAILAQAWATSPWTGLGMGASTVALQVVQSDIPMVAHNEYLRLGVDTGWIGVGLFALAMMAWLHGVVRAGRSGRPGVREYALPGLAGILAWGVVAVTDNPLDYYGAFTQFVALFVGGARVAAGAGEPGAAGARGAATDDAMPRASTDVGAA